MISQAFAPWRQATTWTSLAHLAIGMPIAGVLFGLTVAGLSITASTLLIFPVAIPAAWVFFGFAHAAATFERTRISSLLDIELIDPVVPSRESSWWRRLLEKVRSGARWREIAYLVLGFPVAIFAGVVALGTWALSLVLLSLPLVVDRFPDGVARIWGLEIGPGAGSYVAAALGLVGVLVVAPWVTLAMAAMVRVAASWLLSTDRTEALEAQVSQLESSRSAAVDVAQAERRRIERDLHDGAQQRLVALAMDLGAAKERISPDSPERPLVDAAHGEVKAVIKELRDLVRGIHPVILEDRGLDAALSAVVARFPIPVELSVDVGRRPPAAVESAAYFMVSEALTNVVRHADASRAAVSIARRGDRLVVEVRDDGKGGADPDGGTGFSGLRDRASSLGGWMQIASPVGGPTTIVVELPCES